METKKNSRLQQRLREYAKSPSSAILAALVMLCTAITFFVLLFLIVFILVKGVTHITPDLFSFTYTTENASLMPALINTLIMTALSLVIAVPIGVASAIFLVEYAGKGSKLVGLIRITAVIMILPLIMRTTEEALKAVPDSYREASFGLGAGKLRTIFRIVLPSAVPGILAGVILATGRIVGETAALMYTAGTVAQVPKSLMGSGRTLAVHMYALSSEGLYMDQAYATAVILLVIVLLINWLSGQLAKRIAKG